jgi:hypothetical protein
MREFKFRVWDLEKKFYLNQDDEFHFYEPDRGWQCPIPLCECLRDKKRYVVQQYTGLTDKNKNLIYEGDIVKFSRLFEKERKIKELKSFVRFHNGQFGFDLIGFNDMFFTLSDECGIEVIGNIFEHPELLN